MGIVTLSLHFSAYLKFFIASIPSSYKKVLEQGKRKRQCYSQRRRPQGVLVLGSSARWDSPPQELEKPALYQPWVQSHGQEVILVSLLPPQAGLVPVAG